MTTTFFDQSNGNRPSLEGGDAAQELNGTIVSKRNVEGGGVEYLIRWADGDADPLEDYWLNAEMVEAEFPGEVAAFEKSLKRKSGRRSRGAGRVRTRRQRDDPDGAAAKRLIEAVAVSQEASESDRLHAAYFLKMVIANDALLKERKELARQRRSLARDIREAMDAACSAAPQPMVARDLAAVAVAALQEQETEDAALQRQLAILDAEGAAARRAADIAAEAATALLQQEVEELRRRVEAARRRLAGAASSASESPPSRDQRRVSG